ncbi:hypothetical protein GOP47_0024779 [Adiantum capillus-veneris]|uniref:RING-type E3 ubiquitin transferase (cysteine targeting) n=1 Tax=Adiantum capillus-veneris TaxID=13818 RepID=A0A9D4U4N6_ADICA|nr:hypothetical protein GOP47_0024779 [Adiantum capillus-veneris]
MLFLYLLLYLEEAAREKSSFKGARAFGGSAPTLQSQMASPWLRISRASQLDAAQSDQNDISMLKEQLKKVFSMMPNHFFSTYEPELMALLHLCVWRFSIWADKPTPGNASKNLRYKNDGAFQVLLNTGKVKTGLEGPGLSKMQKVGFLLFTVGVPYCWARLQNVEHSESQDMLVKRIEKFYKVANLANFILFLNTGWYRTIIDRVLKARLVYQKPNVIQIATSELFNRKLVWDELSELLLIFLPMLKRACMWMRSKWGSATRATTEEGSCVVCTAKPITIPYIARPCGHLYCYYCLSSRCSAYRSFQCAYCNQEVTSMERFVGP